MLELIVSLPPGSPSFTGQGKLSCHHTEKIRKSSFSPLLDTREGTGSTSPRIAWILNNIPAPLGVVGYKSNLYRGM